MSEPGAFFKISNKVEIDGSLKRESFNRTGVVSAGYDAYWTMDANQSPITPPDFKTTTTSL